MVDGETTQIVPGTQTISGNFSGIHSVLRQRNLELIAVPSYGKYINVLFIKFIN